MIKKLNKLGEVVKLNITISNISSQKSKSYYIFSNYLLPFQKGHGAQAIQQKGRHLARQQKKESNGFIIRQPRLVTRELIHILSSLKYVSLTLRGKELIGSKNRINFRMARNHQRSANA